MNKRLPPAPAHLTADGRHLWREVVAAYVLEPHHLAILAAACEAVDRQSEARARIAADGPYIEGRYGMRAHPAIAVERDSRLALLRAVRELGLDLETPPTSRPPTRWRDR